MWEQVESGYSIYKTMVVHQCPREPGFVVRLAVKYLRCPDGHIIYRPDQDCPHDRQDHQCESCKRALYRRIAHPPEP